MTPIDAIPLAEIEAARERIDGLATRTPLLRLPVESANELWLKLECLQPIGSFKIRGAGNAVRKLSAAQLSDGVYTASAGNMAQGVAWVARERGVPCTVVIPDHAPATKRDAIERLGATLMPVPFERWWQVLVEHGHPRVAGHFVHPVCDPDVIAGNATAGLEIIEDLPDVDEVFAPYGGGGLSAGIATAIHATRPDARVYGCEVEHATPLRAALAAGKPVPVTYTPCFVDGVGSTSVLAQMWPLVRSQLAAARVVTLAQVAAAIRLLVERARIVAEGAGAAPVAAALASASEDRKIVCVVSGGNIDPDKLATILRGEVP